MRVPTRADVRQWLTELARGAISREQAANAARPWITDREAEVTDSALWGPLASLGGADLEAGPGEYLYDVWDFSEWLAEYELAVDFEEPPAEDE